MIWLKRLLPFAIIVAAVFGYRYYSEQKAVRDAEVQHRYALATAQVWVASAKYRYDPERFFQVRDSILASHSLTTASMDSFAEVNKDQAEKLYPFSTLVNDYLDSLLDIEDSLLQAVTDSIRNAATDSTR
ncbi:MAG: hypothetical protein AB1483_02785 [Candidatus Zixiibacteriota bacterium]